MRLTPVFTLLVLIAATPLHGWDFSVTPICTLAHATDDSKLRVTYDPYVQEYAIMLTSNSTAWPDAPVFTLRFEGPRSHKISTTRHRLNHDRTTLTVTDTGFGNVLDGLEFNDTATAIVGAKKVTVPLSGAAASVREFRACADASLA